MSRNPSTKRGRILRLKQGYNPNSSSIGTILFALPASLLGATAAFGAAAGLIAAVVARGGGRRVGPAIPPPPGPDADQGDEGADG